MLSTGLLEISITILSIFFSLNLSIADILLTILPSVSYPITQGVSTMRSKSISFFVGIFLLFSLLAPSSVHAWSITPQKVTFVSAQGITLIGWLFKTSGGGPYPAVLM